ncbi:hypothetical protein ACHAXT_001955 [Thalassiosira profunda]
MSKALLPPAHPSLAFLVHYSLAIPCIFYVHDAFFAHPDDSAQDEAADVRQAFISKFLFAYTLILFCTRYFTSFRAGRLRHHSVAYELCWLCNSTLVMGCITFSGHHSWWLFRRRPLVATACCVSVSIDQVLWYVDLLGWILRGTLPVGVMKYLTWEQTLWIDRFTCTHHLWTQPLLIYGASTQLGWDSFKLSAFVVFIHVVLSRILTPHCIQTKAESRYLNVNLSHELWRDISFFPYLLQISHDNPPGWLYLFRLLWRWQLFNGLVFVGVLCPLSRLLQGELISAKL